LPEMLSLRTGRVNQRRGRLLRNADAPAPPIGY